MSIKLGNSNITLKVGDSAVTAAYLGSTLAYSGGTPPTPTGSTCYEIISTPITSYTSTTYDSVYSYTSAKWYMLNNLDQYEEYGIYDVTGSTLSDYTYYDGKLVAIGTTEYQYSGNTWVEVGTYEDASVTYTIDDTYPSPYIGETLSTTFKIPVADVETLGGWFNFGIKTSDGGTLDISTDQYNYMGNDWEEGTVTNDGTYYNYSLPNTQSIVIESIDYWDSNPIHFIVGSKQVSVEYQEKDMPLGNVYDTVAEMEAVGCPNVGVGQYGVVGNDAYQFDGEDWNSVTNYKVIEKNADGKVYVFVCNSSTDLVKEETQPSYFGNITDVVIGDCVTSIGQEAFNRCSSLTSVTIPNSITSIGDIAFNECVSLTSIDIPSSVTSIDNSAFRDCRGLTSVTIGSGVTSIDFAAFMGSSSLTSITINATTPPTLGSGVFDNTNNCPIYVPSDSVETYKAASFPWSDYASRIQAIPSQP